MWTNRRHLPTRKPPFSAQPCPRRAIGDQDLVLHAIVRVRSSYRDVSTNEYIVQVTRETYHSPHILPPISPDGVLSSWRGWHVSWSLHCLPEPTLYTPVIVECDEQTLPSTTWTRHFPDGDTPFQPIMSLDWST